MTDNIKISSVSYSRNTVSPSECTNAQASDNSIFDSVSDENISEIEAEIEKKQKEYEQLSLKLKYLQGDPELIQEKEEKQQKAEKIAGIAGGITGGIGTGALFLAGTSLVADAGLALALCIAAPAAVIGMGIVGGIAAGVTGLVISKKNANEDKNRQEEISQLQDQLERLSQEIASLKSELASKTI